MTVLFDKALLPTGETIWAWQKELNSFGPRLTGSEAHRRSIDFLQSKLEAVGLQVARDRLHFTRWEAKRWGLCVETQGGNSEELGATSCFPYSGQTPPDGVTGELVHFRRAPCSFAAAAGKIAVVEVPIPSIPRFLAPLLFRRRTRIPDRSADFALRFKSPLLSLAVAPNLAAAVRAEVLGVICVWRGCSDANAAGQYLPFNTPYEGCPALWVGAATGDRLRDLARGGARVRLTLEATLEPGAPTDTIHAVLPGTNPDETIIINSHSDGANACEENGVVGLLALAHGFAAIPPDRRRRSIVFVVATGHFQIPQLAATWQATSTWLRQHPEWWDGKPGHRTAIAGITLEHLGAMEWKDDDAVTGFRATGRPELELVYATSAVMERIYLKALGGRTMTRTMTVRPRSDIYFGEGQPLFEVGVPTISLIPLPDYLCAVAPSGNMEKLNASLMCEQIETFAKVVAMIDQTPSADLGGLRSPPFGILAAVRVARDVLRKLRR